MKTMQARVILLITFIATLFFIFLMGYTYTRQRADLFDSAIEHSMDMTIIEAEAVGNTIKGVASSLQMLADHPKFKAWDETYIQEELTRFKVFNGSRFNNALYIREDGFMRDVEGREGNIIEEYSYDDMLNSSEVYTLTRIHLSALTNVPCFDIGVQVRDDYGKVIGALAVSIDVNEFSYEIKNMKLDGDSYPWITDESGTIAVHPIENYPYYVSMLDFESLGYEGFEEIATRILAGEEGFASYNDHNIGENKLVTFTEIPNTPGWSLNITTLEDDIYGDANGMLLETAIIVFIFIFISLIFMYRFIIKLMKPIKDLTEVVQESMKRGFKAISVDSGTEEINGLVQAFNNMTEEIHGYTNDLENLANERTEELGTVNDQLNQQNEQLATAVQNLNVLAGMDNLTGLKNRMALFSRLEYMKKSIQSNNLSKFSLLFMDLDNFKYFNDSFGHDVGDMILKDIGKLLKDLLRSGDFIARYGGDEFVVLLENTEGLVTEQVSRKIIQVIEDYNGEILRRMQKEKGQPLLQLDKQLGLSIGMVDVNGQSKIDIDELIKQADALMYRNKERRKGTTAQVVRLDFINE